jgi:hypothetical protein
MQATRLNLPGCARLLQMPVKRLKAAVRGGQFPEPAGTENGQPYWFEAHAYGWAISAVPEVAGRIPLWYWPEAAGPAPFSGARNLGDAGMALGWDIPGLGTVFVAWPVHDGRNVTSRVKESMRDAAGVVIVEHDFSAIGPSVRGVLPAIQGEAEYTELSWPKVAAVIGGPLPYWPSTLRIPELIGAWRPGAPPVTAAADPDLDVLPLFRLAAAMEDGSPAQRVVINLARISQYRVTSSAEVDLKLLASHTPAETAVVAARPMHVPEASMRDMDPSVRRAGWLEILSRDDTLAAACVRQINLWDGGKDFPASNPETVQPDESPLAAEWARRLRPASRTARFEPLDPDHAATETLADPETDAPVIRRADGSLLAAVPQRLSATSRLAELILDQPIWVRTANGTLYLAPKDAYWGLSWGYPGTGPGTLAVLASRLLADINTAPAEGASDAPEGLHALMQQDWPSGTVLTRAHLEAARDNMPWPPE